MVEGIKHNSLEAFSNEVLTKAFDNDISPMLSLLMMPRAPAVTRALTRSLIETPTHEFDAPDYLSIQDAVVKKGHRSDPEPTSEKRFEELQDAKSTFPAKGFAVATASQLQGMYMDQIMQSQEVFHPPTMEVNRPQHIDTAHTQIMNTSRPHLSETSRPQSTVKARPQSMKSIAMTKALPPTPPPADRPPDPPPKNFDTAYPRISRAPSLGSIAMSDAMTKIDELLASCAVVTQPEAEVSDLIPTMIPPETKRSSSLSTISERTEVESTPDLRSRPRPSAGLRKRNDSLVDVDVEDVSVRFSKIANAFLDKNLPASAFRAPKARVSLRTTISKPFLRTCICDISMQSSAIKSASESFHPGLSALQVGKCTYLNLAPRKYPDGSAMLSIEVDPSNNKNTFILHVSSYLYNYRDNKESFRLVSQIDISNAVRGLAISDASVLAASPGSAMSPPSPQLQSLFSLIDDLVSSHSKAVCFKQHKSRNRSAWNIAYLTNAGAQDLAYDVNLIGNPRADLTMLFRAMQGSEPFVQELTFGGTQRRRVYFVPLLDVSGGDQSMSKDGDKSWISFIARTRDPFFWNVNDSQISDTIVYPFKS